MEPFARTRQHIHFQRTGCLRIEPAHAVTHRAERERNFGRAHLTRDIERWRSRFNHRGQCRRARRYNLFFAA
jgi:hypothetical protein